VNIFGLFDPEDGGTSIEKSLNICQSSQHNITEDVNLQVLFYPEFPNFLDEIKKNSRKFNPHINF